MAVEGCYYVKSMSSKKHTSVFSLFCMRLVKLDESAELN